MQLAALSRKPVQRYAFAILITVAATAIALVARGPLRIPGLGAILFPMAVLLAAWLGGMGPGILSAATAAVAVAFFGAHPIGSLAVESSTERLVLGIFVMVSIVESTIIGTSRRTERGLSRLNESVRTSEEKYRLLFERNPDPMWIYDERTNAILSSNASALRAYGYSAKEVTGMPIDRLFDSADARRFNAGEMGCEEPERWRHRTKDGARLEVETRCASVPWYGGHACLLVARDVTAQHRAETELRATSEALRSAKDVAERAAQARDQFLMVLSHELRTPLTPVLLAAAALEARPSLAPDIRRTMGMIRNKVKLEARLIDDLLDVARIINGDFELSLKATNVTVLVLDVVDASTEAASAKGVELAQDVEPGERTVAVDAERLRQALRNLIVAAVDETRAGGTVRVWLHDGPNDEIEIGVSQTGTGIGRDDLARIFDPFETTTSQRAWSLGLGLAISKGITEASGGRIVAKALGSDKGTAFVMYLPRARAV
jgi:two-component system CheB/CheR fusion protein